MEKTRPISRVLRFVLYLFLFFILVSIIVWVYLNFYLNKRIITSLKEQVSEASHGKYLLTLSDLDINPWTRSISVEDLIIAPSRKELLPKAQYVIKANTIKINSVSIMSYLNDNELIVGVVEFEEPQISVFQGSDRMRRKRTDSVLSELSLYEVFSKRVKSVSVGQIDIMNAQFNVYEGGLDTVSVFASKDNSVSIRDFNIDKETDESGKLFSAKKFEVVMNDFSCQLGDGMYTLFGKRLHTSYTDSTLSVDSLMLIPNFDKKEFAEEAGRQVSRINLVSSKVICSSMDVKLLFEYNWVVMQKLEMQDCLINVHRDNRQELAPIVRPSPQAMIKSIPFFVSIDSIRMTNGTVVYQERNFDQVASDRVTVNAINGTITGVYNDSTYYSDKSSIKAALSAKFMDQGTVRVNFDFPLQSTAEYFSCTGSLSAMPLPSLNVMIPRAKKTRFISGQLDNASFSFVAKGNISTGTMKFLYHDLKVEIGADEKEKPNLKDKLTNFLANELVVIDSNPDKKGVTRVSPIYVERNSYRYFIFYAMQSVVSGMNAAIQDKEAAKLLAGKNTRK